MKLGPFKYPEDVATSIRDELFVVASLLSTASDAADWKFQDRDVEAAVVIYAAHRKVGEILAAIADALAKEDEYGAGAGGAVTNGEGA